MDGVQSNNDASGPDTGAQRTGRRRVVVLAVGALLVVLIAWAAYAASLAFEGRDHLHRAEERVPAVRAAAAETDLDAATGLLAATREDLSTASRALGHPALAPARALPMIGVDLRIARALAEGGLQVMTDVTRLIEELGDDAGGLGALTPQDGALPVTTLAELGASLRGTADNLHSLLDDLEGLQPSGYVDEVTAAHERVMGLLSPLAEQADTAATLVYELARFLGAEGTRTYLLGASTPAELRGTGGFIGSIAPLQVDDGELSIGEFAASSDLPVLPATELPPPNAEDAGRWRRYGGTGLWVNLNYTADFPSAADAMLRHLHASRDEEYDGMIVVDPFTLEALLALSGPADVPGYDVTLTSDTVVDFVLNEAYAIFEDPEERKAVLGAVSATTLGRFLEGGADELSPRVALDRFGSLARGGHVLLYSRDDATQDAFAAAGLDGSLGLQPDDPARDLVTVALNNGSANKLDFYAERRVRIETTLLDDGSARSELALELHNAAPTEGQPAYVIGPNSPGLTAGEARSNVRVYLAPGARFEDLPPDDGSLAWTERELDHPVHERWVRLEAGETVEEHYRWRTPDAWWSTPDGRIHYELALQGQTVVRPTEVEIALRIPEGTTVVSELPDGAALSDRFAVWEGSVRGEEVRLPVTIARTGEEEDDAQ